MTAIALAMSGGLAQSPEVITLSGTSGSPNVCLWLETSPTDCTAYIDFATSGLLVATGYTTPAGEWCSRSPGSTFYIRATEVSQTGGGTRTGTLNTALALTSLRRWSILNTSNLLSNPDWVLKFEISANSSMTPILATGYYKLIAAVDTGA